MSLRYAARSILVVESDAETRSGMKRLLEMSGYRVTAAADEQEAMQLALHEHPDLILLDANLPPPASLSAAHRIHQHSELRDVPVAVISVHEHTEDDSFTVGYITDLSRFDELENLIGRLLPKHPERAM